MVECLQPSVGRHSALGCHTPAAHAPLNGHFSQVSINHLHSASPEIAVIGTWLPALPLSSLVGTRTKSPEPTWHAVSNHNAVKTDQFRHLAWMGRSNVICTAEVCGTCGFRRTLKKTRKDGGPRSRKRKVPAISSPSAGKVATISGSSAISSWHF